MDAVFIFIFVVNQPNVNEMSGYFQYSYSTAWQHPSEAAPAKVLISVPQNESSRLFLSCHFAPMLKKNKKRPTWRNQILNRCVLRKGCYSLSQLFLLLSPHRKSQTEVDKAGWGKVSKPEKAKNYCRLATPAHNFHFAYCSLARLNRHIAQREKSFQPGCTERENRWLAAPFFARSSAATSDWTKTCLAGLPLVFAYDCPTWNVSKFLLN